MFNENDIKMFKKIIDEMIDNKLDKRGITTYVSAKVQTVNNDGTVNVFIPPDENNYVKNILNKTGETLNVGDSIELCTKNGRLTNCWAAIKHNA